MSAVLLLVHRIPYPPNKGDKIRSFNLLKQLARSHEVHLGAFVDDPADWAYERELSKWCADTMLRPLNPTHRKLVSLGGLFTGEALTVPYYRDKVMAQWVNAKCRDEGIEQIVVFSSAMAQYVRGPHMRARTRVVDLVDVDSEKWRAYAARHRWPMNWVYRREARRLLSFERAIAAECDAAVLVSPQEAQLFRQLAPESAAKIHAVYNGVDTEYFSPRHPFDNPFPAAAKALVFTGAMDYWANVDAVTWFADEIFPQIRQQMPEAVFFVVGARPTEQVRKLERRAGITVTGAVPDIRPYLAHAAAAVAPLRIARGIQNKVLEAMAMAKPVLATTAAMEGIAAPDQWSDLTCDDPQQFAAGALALLSQGDRQGYGALGRVTVVKHYGWAESFSRFDQLLAEHGGARGGTATARPATAQGAT